MQFEIRTLEQCACNEFRIGQADQNNGYRIIWVQKGDGLFKIDMQNLIIKENVVYLLSPGQMCVLGTQGKAEGYYIYLSPEFIHLSDRRSISSFFAPKYNSLTVRSIQPDLELRKDLEDIMIKILKELSSFTPSKLEILKGLFNIFVIYLSSGELMQGKERFDRGTELAGEFFDLLNNHYRTKKMVSEYASILYVSPNYLNRSVKKISGFAARYHIQQAIVVEAKRQAIYTGSTMKEIAYFLGFKDYAHFSKFFKNNSGINFTSFKKNRGNIKEDVSPFTTIGRLHY